MIYLDHAATTPLDPRVLAAMEPHFSNNWGNPSSPHAKGREARAAIDSARQTIADLIGIKAHEVIFVSSGSEGNSLALFGRCDFWEKRTCKPGNVILLSTEHHCSLKAIDKIRDRGWEVTLLPVSKQGVMRLDDLRNAINADTALVSIQWANSEMGVIQHIEEVATVCQEADVPFHCDAIQGIGALALPQKLPDLITIAAHKFYGPKGIGALIVRGNTELDAQILGGGQEFELRAGTENTPAIVGMAKALEIVMEELTSEALRLTLLRDSFIAKLECLPNVTLNGDRSNRLPNNINVHIEGKSAEMLVIQLDLAGICAASGSACATGATEPSHVMMAMGQSTQEAQQNIRFSLGHSTTEKDLQEVAKKLEGILENAKVSA